MKSAVFIGHGVCYNFPEERLKEILIENIKNGVTHFYSGGQGDFDVLCARTVYRLKERYPHIKNYLVIPYLSFNVFDKTIFDEIIFPDFLEKYHFKAAIPQRNRYMVNCTDVAICYIQHGWGNAFKTFEYATRKKLKIINISNYYG